MDINTRHHSRGPQRLRSPPPHTHTPLLRLSPHLLALPTRPARARQVQDRPSQAWVHEGLPPREESTHIQTMLQQCTGHMSTRSTAACVASAARHELDQEMSCGNGVAMHMRGDALVLHMHAWRNVALQAIKLWQIRPERQFSPKHKNNWETLMEFPILCHALISQRSGLCSKRPVH